LGNGYLEFLLEALKQFLLGESQVLFLLLPQPSSALNRHFVRVATAMVNERLPSGTSLAVATAEVGQRAMLEGETQFPAKLLKLLSLAKTLEESFLSQGAIDLTDGVPFHGISPWLRYSHDTTYGPVSKISDW
jgi:hypothetical protein